MSSEKPTPPRASVNGTRRAVALYKSRSKSERRTEAAKRMQSLADALSKHAALLDDEKTSRAERARLSELLVDVERVVYRVRDERRVALLRLLAEFDGVQSAARTRPISEQMVEAIAERLERESGIACGLIEVAIDAWTATSPHAGGRGDKEAAWSAICENVNDAWALGDAEEALAALKKPKKRRS